MAKTPAQQQKWPGTVSELTPQPDHGERTWKVANDWPECALNTGADSGIGRAIAVTYAAQGADIAIAHLPQEKTTRRSPSGSLRWRNWAGSTSSSAMPDSKMSHGSLEEFPPERIERTFATNVFSPFGLAQALAGELEDGG